MHRREMLSGMAASVLMSGMGNAAEKASNTLLEVKTWRLHNTEEKQSVRLGEYLENGLAPSLKRAGAALIGAFSNVIGQDGPYYVTVTEFASLGQMGESLEKMRSDEAHGREFEKLNNGPGLPFVRVESSLLRSFDAMPEPAVPPPGQHGRVFELRTYESQSFGTLARKVGMFNNGEAQIFERLGFHPVFFGETIVGPKQPNLMYMLSYDSLAARDQLWKAFGSDPEWKKLVSRPELQDSEIVANISNVILAPLRFSTIQ